MHLKFLGLLLLLCNFAVGSAMAATAPNFDVVLEDTAPGEIKAIFQDRAGFMWFGGRNSLLRYDAYKFQNIQAIEQKGSELKKVSPYFVTNIFQDSQGTLWIISLSGLYIFDVDREILIRPAAKDGALDAYFLGRLQDIAELSTGELIVGSDESGIAIFDKNTLKISWRQIDSQQNPNSAAMQLDRSIQKILIDSKQRIWISSNRGLNLFDLATKTFTLFIPNPNKPESKEDNTLITLAEAPNGTILGGTFGAGFFIFNPRSHEFRQFKTDLNNPNSISENAIWQITVDSNNRIWIGLSRDGVSLFDPHTETFTRYSYAYGQPGAPAYGAIMSLYEDKNGNIWTGHYPGKVSFHDLNSEAITVYRANPNNPEAISDSDIQAVMEDKNHNLWLGVGEGVEHFYRKNEKFKHYSAKLGNYPARGSLSGYIDRQDVPWIGTWSEGLYHLNKTTDRFEPIPMNAALATSVEKHSSELNDSTVWGACETQDNTFWIATHNAGINRYDQTTGIFTKYASDNTPNSLANNIAWNCYEDSKGRFWVGTANGLSLMDRTQGTFKNYVPQEDNLHSLHSGSVLAIYEDAKGRLWFATNGGLHLYREESDDFEVFTTDDGFVNNSIRALTGDLAGNLWLGTNNGIIQFNPNTHTIKNYTVFGGKKSGAVNTGAALTSAAGEVMFGTTDGLIIIDAVKLTTNQTPPPVVLTDFKIFARSVSFSDTDSVLKKVIDKTESIRLDYTKRMFSFEFAALNFSSADKNRYAYKLEGFDREWREIGTAREAQYTNISPGEYVFKVRASNNDGIWSEIPKSIEVVQLPPPWKTWWAYTLYGGLALSFIAYWANVQKRKQRLVEEQNRLLEIKVAQRTHDLAEKNNDIQSLLSNMRQGLFTIEEGGTIHHEYSVFLESIFETHLIAQRDAIEVLFANATLDDDEISQVQSSVYSIMGEDEINYELNAHLLITEYSIFLHQRTKIISLDWNPILDSGGTVTKLMVSVRDVTELKILELAADNKKREISIISQIFLANVKRFIHYYDSALRYINENKQLAAQCDTFDKEVMGKLFRNMHTVKGNSRAHGFTFVANAAHEAESFFDQVQHLGVDEARVRLLSDLDTVAYAIKEYFQVYSEMLGRDAGAQQGSSGVWMSRESVDEIKHMVEAVKQLAPESYRSIVNIIDKSSSVLFAEIISPSVASLPAIAAELGKQLPDIVINDQGLLIKYSAHAVVCDVVTHLLRNSLDHGIEDANTRIALKKKPSGTIVFNLSVVEPWLVINVSDDGRGLNLSQLYQKGLESGVFDAAAKLTRLTVANSIFVAGLSTKQGVDTISGRGVGMDAVKQFLLEFGGDIAISIEEPEQLFIASLEPQCAQFVLSLTLPRSKCVVE